MSSLKQFHSFPVAHTGHGAYVPLAGPVFCIRLHNTYRIWFGPSYYDVTVSALAIGGALQQGIGQLRAPPRSAPALSDSCLAARAVL